MTRFEKAREIDCNYILNQAGYKAKKQSNGRFFYLSPYRNESNPSLVVHPDNKWADQGVDLRPKSSIDLYCLLYDVDAKEAVSKMLGDEYNDAKKFDKTSIVRESGTDIVSIKDISSDSIVRYVESRCIDVDLARKYCKELLVKFPFGKHPEKFHKVIGWQCDRGGWEMRNEYLKVGSTPKGPTSVVGGSSTCVLFEGMFDYLSLLMTQSVSELKSDVFIYNSTSFLDYSIPNLQKYSKVCSFVDNDDAGDKVVNTLKENGVWIKDYRHLYSEYNDLNECLVEESSKYTENCTTQ